MAQTTGGRARGAAGTSQREPLDIVDAHCHASDVWYEPFEALRFQLNKNGISGAVIVQIHGQWDNTYLRDWALTDQNRYAWVTAVNVAAGDAPDQLRRAVMEGAAGARLHAGARSAAGDPLSVWSAAAELHIPVSVSGRPRNASDVEELARLIVRFPQLNFVIEHLGGGGTPSKDWDVSGELRKSMMKLSRFSNTYMKVGGIGEIASRSLEFAGRERYEAPVPDFHMQAYESFGPDRLMWGSSYSAVSNREGYAAALSSALGAYAGVPVRDRAQIFGGTARALYFKPAAGTEQCCGLQAAEAPRQSDRELR